VFVGWHLHASIEFDLVRNGGGFDGEGRKKGEIQPEGRRDEAGGEQRRSRSI